MKKLILLITLLTTIGCQSDIYKDENGIIKCIEDIQIGYIGEVDGVSYKVVDSTMLYTMVKNNEDLRFICTSKITNTSKLFYKSDFNGDISNWDVSNVTDMEGMFSGMYNYSKINRDMSSWDVSSVVEWRFFSRSNLPPRYRPRFKN